MASAESAGASTTEPVTVPSTLRLPRAMGQTAAESTPVEMKTLRRQEEPSGQSTGNTSAVPESKPIQTDDSTADHGGPSTTPNPSSQQLQPSIPLSNTTSTAPPRQTLDSAPQDPTSSTSTSTHNPLLRTTTQPAIGPSSDKPTPVQTESSSSQTLFITLLLTNGARHPYKIDEKYLHKRNVSVEGDNPILMSIYTLKELIWREWREEWEPRPSSPSSIRLIYAGFMPGDNSRLQECKFKLGPTPHVVHMTVKPQDFIDEEEAQKGGGREREVERSPRCRCCVM